MENKMMFDVAQNLVDNSIDVKPQMKVLIRAHYEAKPLVKACIKLIGAKGGYPYVELIDDELKKDQMVVGDENMWSQKAAWELQMYQDIDALIVIRPRNDVEIGAAKEKLTLWAKEIMPSRHFYINKRKWVLLTYPTELMSHKFGMSNDEFANFWHQVSSFNYQIMAKEAEKLKSLMEKTNQVRIVAKDTDITFSIKDIPVIICAGQMNIPDGEVYTAPVKNSVNGVIKYNVPSSQSGALHQDVKLTFKDGKIIDFDGSHKSLLEEIFGTDEGAKYIGEFAIGINPFITKATGDILFDEKITGSIHFTPGNSYEDAYNGNNSAIHWDLVQSHRVEHGGGEIYFDDVLIRKDGEFVIEELKSLNQNELIKLAKQIN